VSGEDRLTVDRKYREPWTGQIPARFLILSNELPLPGILAWSLDGLDRLTRAGALTEPASSADAIMALQDLVSPVSAFVRDWCVRGGEIPVGTLFSAWKQWCEINGHKPGSAQTLGRDLRAVVPVLRVSQPRI
jgi:putative DNA primase/helicase